MPVLIFCDDPLALQQQLDTAEVFLDGNVGVQLAVLDSLRETSNAIVITNSNSSKGVDFLFASPRAYVIHTVLPSSVVGLK